MNLADLTSLIIVANGLVCPIFVCVEYKAAWWLYPCLALGGLIISFLIADRIRKFAYLTLKEGKNRMLQFIQAIFYFTQPFLAIGVLVGLMLLSSFALEKLGYSKDTNESEVGSGQPM